MMKPRSSYSKTAFILLFSVFLVAAVTKAKSSLPDITLEQAKEINADNTVIFLFRHGERCDRSDMPCYSDKSGITITGTEKAQQEGGFAPIFPDICYHLTHYKPAAADIPVASDNPAHYADAIRYNARTPLQGSLLPLTRLVWA